MAENENPTAAQIARAAGIAPRTKNFVLRDEYGFAFDGSRTEHVLDALQREDLAPGLGQRTRICAIALRKCYATGRMNVELARHVRERCTPYQLCALLARITALYPGFPTVGELADGWINEHREELTQR
jgi:hypothetical protein